MGFFVLEVKQHLRVSEEEDSATKRKIRAGGLDGDFTSEELKHV